MEDSRIQSGPWRKAVFAVLLLLALFGAMLVVESSSTEGAPGDKLYWSDPATQKIQRADLDGSNVEDIITGVDAFDIEIDSAGGKLYWTEAGDIYLADLDGTNAQQIMADGSAGRIALDLTNSKLYWTSGSEIRRASLDGAGQEVVLTSGTTVIAVDVDPAAGKVYYYSSINILRANLDGSGVEQINFGSGGAPADIALDLKADMLYWVRDSHQGTALCNIFFHAIDRADLDGTSQQHQFLFPATTVAIGTTGDVFWGQYQASAETICGLWIVGSPGVTRGNQIIVPGVVPSSIAIALADPPPLPTPTPDPVGGVARSTGLAPLPAADESAGSAGLWLFAVALAGVGAALSAAWYARRKLVPRW